MVRPGLTTALPGDDVSSGYASQLDALRSVTKWLLAAFAGVGVILVAGVSISGIGRLPIWSWRLYIAVAAAAGALGAVGYIIREVSIVLTHEWLTLASFGEESTNAAFYRGSGKWRSALLRDIDDRLEMSRHELFGYVAATRPELHTRMREADERLLQCRPGSRRALKSEREAAVIRKAARDTVQYANYYFTLRLFQRMRVKISWAAAYIAIAVAVYVYAVSTPRI